MRMAIFSRAALAMANTMRLHVVSEMGFLLLYQSRYYDCAVASQFNLGDVNGRGRAALIPPSAGYVGRRDARFGPTRATESKNLRWRGTGGH